jgi:hypothetical protein
MASRRPLIWLGSASPYSLGNGGDVFKYKLHTADCDDLGEATYAVMLQPGEEIHLGANRFRVVDLVPFREEDKSPFAGMLRVEAA